MKYYFSLKILIVAVIIALFATLPATAAEPARVPVSPAASKDLRVLLDMMDAGTEADFDINRIPALMAFVYQAKPANVLYTAGESFDSHSAYAEFDINNSFEDFLKFSFNPDLPSYLLMPASVRYSHWKIVNGRPQPLPKLWQALPALSGTMTLRGIEFIENTPDLNSGAYFAYDLDRLLILTRYKGRFVLLSMSKQTSVSDVGKKGVILGPDEEWTYLYSGQNGINRPGLGWVSSYMYDSYSVAVYAQIEKGQPGVRCSTFKWVNAGWSRINMVRKKHIHDGLLRYTKAFKEIMDAPVLPEADTIAKIYSRIRNFSLSELQAIFHGYLDALEARHGDDDAFPRKWFQEWFKSKRYLQQLTKEEMESTLMVEYMKKALGRPSQIEVGDILGVHLSPLGSGDRLAYNRQ